MTYAPVRVTNPTSKFHSVALHRGQDFVLSLDAALDKVNTGPLIKVKEILKDDEGGVNITFAHEELDIDFDSASTVFLGDVTVITQPKEKDIPARKVTLCVFLNCTNPLKKDVVTVIDPQNATIKIDPHQVLEVVVYDPHFGSCDEWDCALATDKSQLEVNFHPMGKRVLALTTAYMDDYKEKSDIYFMQARNRIWHHPTCREHHFWFRLDNRIEDIVKTKDNDIYYVGDIEFRGRVSAEASANGVSRTLRVFLNQKNKYHSRVEAMLQIKDLEALEDDEEQLLPLETDKKKNKDKKKSGKTSAVRDPLPTVYHNTKQGPYTWSDGSDDYDSYHGGYYSRKSIREIGIELVPQEDELAATDCWTLPIIREYEKQKLRKEKISKDGTLTTVEL